MSYYTAPPFDSGPPGPLRVTPTGLGHTCTCPSGLGADDGTPRMFLYGGAALAAFWLLTTKTRKRR
jgi:hypothetical protein